MPDPIFAAEMAALAAERRAREKDRVGDGMAVLGVDPKNPNAWMDFSGPRVPVHGSSGGGFDGWVSQRHVHDADCLVPIAGGQRWTKTGDIEVPEPGWAKCSRNGARYHQHASRLMAHQSGDRRACPEPVE
jgi:hypothetical protein